MTADLALRILILVAGIFLLWTTLKTNPEENYEAGIEKYFILVVAVVITIVGLVGIIRYFVA